MIFELGIPTNQLLDWFRPSFNVFTKSARLKLAKPLDNLARWKVTDWDRRRALDQDKAPPTDIDWKERLIKLTNSPFLAPKYSQLLYWIITDTILSGQKLHRWQLNGNCPGCGCLHDTKGMFTTCHFAQEIWSELDNLGSQFWPDYLDAQWGHRVTASPGCPVGSSGAGMMVGIRALSTK